MKSSFLSAEWFVQFQTETLQIHFKRKYSLIVEFHTQSSTWIIFVEKNCLLGIALQMFLKATVDVLWDCEIVLNS